MKRSELLNSKEYWVTKFQLSLFEIVNGYLRDNNISKTQFADQIGVTKGYVSQVLNGDFDHKISKYVELSLACDKVPIVHFVNKVDYENNDLCGFQYSFNEVLKLRQSNTKRGVYQDNIKDGPFHRIETPYSKQEKFN